MADKWQCCDLNPGILVQVLNSCKRLWFLCFFMNVLCVFWTPNALLAQKAWYMNSRQELSSETPSFLQSHLLSVCCFLLKLNSVLP